MDPALSAYTSALDSSAKVAGTPLFTVAVDRLLGFKLSEWAGQGDVIKKSISDGYEEAKQKGLGIQYVSAFRSNTNLLTISAKAAKYITAEVKEGLEMDNDVFWGLLEHSKSISNEEMQDLIAKILAGEYNVPGTYSMSTLQLLKSLGKSELEKFALWNTLYLPDHGFLNDVLTMEREAQEVRRQIGLDFSSFLEMQNLGLINSGVYTREFSFVKDKIYRMDYGHSIIFYKAVEDKLKWNFPPCYQLTNAGRQIREHLEKNESPVFLEWLKTYLMNQGLEVEKVI